MTSQRPHAWLRLFTLAAVVAIAVPLVIWSVLHYQYRLAVDDNARFAAEQGNPLWAGNPPSSGSFNPYYAVPRQPAVSSYQILPAAGVTDELVDDELVIGVEVEGAARAYPINMLTGPTREIINDTVMQKPIAATW